MTNKNKKIKVNVFPGVFVSETEFTDRKNNPYELIISKLPPGIDTPNNSNSQNNPNMQNNNTNNNREDNSNNQDGNDQNDNQNNGDNQKDSQNKPKIQINKKTGKRRIYNDVFKRWMDI